MNLMKIIKRLIFALAALAAFSSCMKEEEKTIATAIMTDKSSLTFGIDDELTQTLTVYADAPWTAEYEGWLTLDPAAGTSGETVVTVTAKANIREELPDRPRESVITFVGQNLYADAVVSVLQNGDKYRDLVAGTLTEAFAQEANTFVGAKDVQVVALTSDGFVVEDETAISYVTSTKEVAVGDKGSVYAYVSNLNGLPSLKDADKFEKSSNATVDYSGAKDITSTLQAYVPEQTELVSLQGKLSSKKIELYHAEGEEPAQRDSIIVELLNTHSSLKMSELDGWLVNAKGYVFGKSGNTIYIVPVVLEGVQSLETVYFADDFEWITWATVDAVGKDDQSTSVTNIWKADWADAFFAKFNEIGYQYLWSTVGDKEFKVGPEQAANPSVGKDGSMYACKNYLKFGQSSYNAALRLPALSSIQGTANIQIDFDWCWQVTGERKPDIMTMSVETTNGKFEQTGLGMSEQLESTQSQTDGESHLAWQHARVILTDATAETVLTIRPTYADPAKQNSARKQNRWYLDNIKIIEYTGSVSVAEPTEAEITISMENNITFDAAPTETKSFTFVSDQEATLTIEADWMYFLGEGDKEEKSITIAADTQTEVKVGCKENTASEPRSADIVIESGLSVETIPVKQMSPGQKVESFVSIIGGNSGKVGFDEGAFNLSVQANVDFAFESDATWATVEAIPESKALVEVKQLVVKYEANDTPVERTARIRVFNAENNLETVYTLVQDAFVSGVFFQDDFNWVQPFVDADIAANRTQGDSMLDNAQYTVSSSYDLTGFEDALTTNGYEALFPSSKAIYVMKGNYLKFSKGQSANGIRLPAMNFAGESTVELTFDWGINCGANGPDDVKLEVVVEGSGSINGASKSSALVHTAGNWEWQTESVIITGVDATTRISIRPTTFTGEKDSAKTYYRWFLDNVKVAKGNPMLAESCTLAKFPFPNNTAFDGTGEGAGTKWNLSEGWILSEDGASKMSAHNYTANKFTYKYEARDASKEQEGIKDHVRALVTGMALGGYWLFEVPVKDAPAGTYNITYKHSASATGPNYFLVEVSLDGQNWQPAEAQTTSETFMDGTSPRDVTWTYALNRGGVNAANVAYVVDVDYSAPALPGSNTIYIRAKIADDMAYGATKAMGTSGTNRIWGPCEVTFRKN